MFLSVRQVHEKNEFGDSKTTVKYVRLLYVEFIVFMHTFMSRPFIIDLESTNGTKVNDEPVPTSRYFELKLGDGQCLDYLDITLFADSRIVIKFGDSLREYVLLSEDAA